MTNVEPIDQTLARAKHVVPNACARARDILGNVLDTLTASIWPDIAFRFSSLTNTGYPVEFAWSSRDPSLRFTFEAAPAEMPDHHRLPKALATLAEWGVDRFHAAHELQSMQISTQLKFGAWIGVRCSENDTTYKLYVELPPGLCTTSWAQSVLDNSSLSLRIPDAVWRMAGFNPAGEIELYARTGNLESVTLRSLVRQLDGNPAIFLELVERLVRQPELPATSGISLAFDTGGAFAGLTLFAFAKHLCSSDAQVHDALLALAKPNDYDTDLYEALSAGKDDGHWRHGMLGFGFQRHTGTWIQAGLRPA
ncbi:MAG: hypothetical protein OEW13_00130 [Nitrospira sp.]|nr:hypothetical protein [Nitrospira sp.]